MNKSVHRPAKDPCLSLIIKTPTIPKQVAEQIIGLIRSGSMKPGEKLPSEGVMTRLLGISRITLREAKKLLEARGYIEPRGKGSTYVSAHKDREKSSIEDLVSIDTGKIWELLQVRRILDSEAASIAARSASSREKKLLRGLCSRAIELGFEDRSPFEEERGRLYADFFDALSRSTHNTMFCYLRKSVNTILTGSLPYSRQKLSSVRGSAKAIISQICSIMDAIEDKDPDAARSAMIVHIDYLEKTLRKAIVHGEA